MLINNNEKIFTWKRLTKDTGVNKESYVSQSSTITGQLQPLSSEDIAIYEGDISRSFKIYVNSILDIKIGDLLIEGNDDYYVKGIQSQNFLNLQHVKLLVERKK